MRLALVLLLLSVGTATAQTLPPLEPGARVAFLGMTFVDLSTEGDYFPERADQTERLEMLNRAVVERLKAEGFEVVDTAPVAEKLAATTDPADCYGCDVRMGEALGADYVLVGQVRKISNLILSENLALRKVPGGETMRLRAADIRSNTDESWLRGLNYLFDNHVFKK